MGIFARVMSFYQKLDNTFRVLSVRSFLSFGRKCLTLGRAQSIYISPGFEAVQFPVDTSRSLYDPIGRYPAGGL